MENRIKDKLLKGGIYLVLDPAQEREKLLEGLKQALQPGKVCAVQLWDHWKGVENKDGLIGEIKSVCRQAEVALLINNSRQMLEEYGFDGIHFDTMPAAPLHDIKTNAGRRILIGLTLGNDLGPLRSAGAEALDYVSFCSVFPSASAGACEIVSRETIQEARTLTHLPVFLSGGINLSTISKLEGLAFEGVAVISGVMSDPDPCKATESLHQSLNKVIGTI
ncbi:MAG: hypothetical protein ABS46_10935 [Cytophagaceae bacterium SCN 52-12]|nr:MAG: hypothetical protein ABS46_10935 [Cytophagaceae bacterium SCN 52-12]